MDDTRRPLTGWRDVGGHLATGTKGSAVGTPVAKLAAARRGLSD